ncbi:hypothetical protein BDZ45DRAFT_801813 [Acephala macrosclerotiorum]|nr:hypothetical protein BDZ45DRAFT_801813 [Acephala macrosclerotiorum]
MSSLFFGQTVKIPKHLGFDFLFRIGGAFDWLRASSAAQDAFEEAERFFLDHLSKDECKRVWLQDKTSIEDIESLVRSAQLRYQQNTGKWTIQKWLAKLSRRIMYYGAVFDTLAQHHPEYVSLAWGTFKLIFVGVLNYEELIERFAESLSHIADVVPWTELSLKLYPTIRMKQIASQLYAYIIKFFQQAVVWYKKRTISKVLSSLSRPYELYYQETVAKIEYYAKAVDNMSNSASRAELRDMHLKINDLTRKFNEMLQVTLSTQSLNQKIHHDLGEQKRMIYDLQLSRIASMIVVKFQPEQVLQMCQSVLDRRRRTRPDLSSSMLLIYPGPRAKSKVQCLATIIIENLRRNNKSVIWSLSNGDTAGEPRTGVSFLKDLVYQALQLAISGPYGAPPSLSTVSFQVAHTQKEWLSLLSLMLSCNKETFIVIEIENSLQFLRKNHEATEEFLEAFRDMVDTSNASSGVKALVISYNTVVSSFAMQHSGLNTMLVESSMQNRRQPVVRCLGKGRGKGRGRGRGFVRDILP